MALSSKAQGHLIMLAVMTVFGLNIPVNKYLYASGYISPFGMTATRMTFAAIAFWLISLFLPKEKVDKRDLLLLVGAGLCGMLCNQGLFAYGLGMTSSVDASIITTSGPLFAMIMAAIILKEPITFQKIGGVLVGGVGAVILVLTAHQIAATDSGNNMMGNLSIFSAQLFYSFYLVITRPLATKYSPITMMKWMFLPSSIIGLLLFGKDMVYAPMFHQSDMTPLLMIAFTLFGATFFTYLMIPLAQRRIRPTTISMYNNLQPLIATIVAIAMMGEKFSVMKLVASVFIFAGVYLVTTSKSKADIETEKIMK
ncbi:DMT family transporter [Dysgonomonas sp. 25]|uniref:DMT family transporter n=1 Tax=Dysgonomonas sp. 25 TaxID=2302933 RepID=UPI0013CF9720|nr:DMT family transporter [Dysgonomonas sp. 25]NDV69640.1 DMT family transporter [Dysgonomonas sp. 25]